MNSKLWDAVQQYLEWREYSNIRMIQDEAFLEKWLDYRFYLYDYYVLLADNKSGGVTKFILEDWGSDVPHAGRTNRFILQYFYFDKVFDTFYYWRHEYDPFSVKE